MTRRLLLLIAPAWLEVGPGLRFVSSRADFGFVDPQLEHLTQLRSALAGANAAEPPPQLCLETGRACVVSICTVLLTLALTAAATLLQWLSFRQPAALRPAVAVMILGAVITLLPK